MNLFKAASLPVNFWTFFMFSGILMFKIAWTLSGFGSIPFADTMQPKIFPFCTPKVYFLEFSFKFPFLRFENVSWRSWIWSCLFLLLITMSST
jgi:hypothetical protein